MATLDVEHARIARRQARAALRAQQTKSIKSSAAKPGKATPRRKFTDEFKLDQLVYIIRHQHGWEDGRVQGRIRWMSETQATVTDPSTGFDYYIDHCRDIRQVRG